jgi:hypothetical protein
MSFRSFVEFAAPRVIERLGRGLFTIQIAHFVHVALLLVGPADRIPMHVLVRRECGFSPVLARLLEIAIHELPAHLKDSQH